MTRGRNEGVKSSVFFFFFTRRSCQFRAFSCGLSISNLAGSGSAVGIHAESSACVPGHAAEIADSPVG